MFQIFESAHRDDAVRDMDVSASLLAEVAAGLRGPTARVFRPGPTVAFGRLDELAPRYEDARKSAERAGFVPVRRLGGGHAAAYHPGSVVLELFTPEQDIAAGTERRFRRATALIVDALAAVGVPAAEGELAGEFCPGRYSVHAKGVKLAGVAQRSVRGASLVAAFVSVEDGAALRRVLVPVYEALGRAWNPGTAGAAEDVVDGVRAERVAAALLDRLDRPARIGYAGYNA